ncbi:MAG: thioredoxin domain-containing protein [Blastocatellia bacterium]|nr:thioredoxin domain-containing protein [Blastocatellia bacterium]
MKEQKMKEVKNKKNDSIIPVVIIVLVLAGFVFGGWWLYSSSKPAANTNSTPAANLARSTPPVNAPLGANPPNMLGSPTASVTVEEFADFQCGSCAAVHPVVKEIQSIYGSKIKLIFRNYPLQMHDKAFDAAVAAEAAGIQGKFWMMQDQLFANQAVWSGPSANHKALWAEYAQKIGLDVPQWQNDIAGIAAKSRVELDMARGRALNVSSTPTIYVNGQAVPFPDANVAGLRRIIDTELQNAPATQAQPARPATSPAASPAAAAPASNTANSPIKK